jgi:hypothetical protein
MGMKGKDDPISDRTLQPPQREQDPAYRRPGRRDNEITAEREATYDNGLHH